MLQQHTVGQLKALKLDGMARAFEEQSVLAASSSLAFEERLAMLVDREIAWRDTRRLERLLRSAKLKHTQACVEDVIYDGSRGLDQRLVATLAGCDWIRNAQSLILTGPTGAGKSWLACAFGQQACRQGFSARSTCACRACSRNCRLPTAMAALPGASLSWPRSTC